MCLRLSHCISESLVHHIIDIHRHKNFERAQALFTCNLMNINKPSIIFSLPLSICNNAGQTAEDIAWSCGFEECGRFLNMHRRTRDLKNASSSPLAERHVLSSTLAGQKRGRATSSAQDGKKARDW